MIKHLKRMKQQIKVPSSNNFLEAETCYGVLLLSAISSTIRKTQKNEYWIMISLFFDFMLQISCFEQRNQQHKS